MTTISNTLACIFILLSSFIAAQQPQAAKVKIDTSGKNQLIKKSKWEGGLLLGGAVYSGDIELSLVESRPVFGLFVRHAMGNYFAFQTSLSQGFLSGNEAQAASAAWRAARKISFKSSLTELALRGEYHFMGYTHKVQDVKSVMDETNSQTFKQKERLISPFVYIGGGLALINPKTNFNDSPLPNPAVAQSRITADKTAKFPKILTVIPFGGGLRIPLVNKQAFLTIEGGFRPTFSDYLDGMSLAGNPNVNDWYFTGDIAYSKFFGNKKDSDGDGIADKNDLCPYLKGDPKLKGCPDRDKDGIADDKDACPTVAGLAIYEGCPDTDGDGIIDKLDDCPNERGLGQYKGCLSDKSKKDSISVGLDTVKAVVDADNKSLKPVDITKPLVQNDSLSLTDNTSKPSVTLPTAIVPKPTEKTDDAPKEVTTIEPEPPAENKIKPIQVVGIQKDTPQPRLDREVQYVGTKPITAVDTTVSAKENPIQVTVPQTTPPQPRLERDVPYIDGKPTEKPTDITKPSTAIDTTVSTKTNPREVVDIQKDTPQSRLDRDVLYVGGKPIGHPTALPEDIAKPVVAVDTMIIVTTENPTYLKPFPSDKHNALNGVSVPVVDTDNAFNIVRNHYSIVPVYFETKKSLYRPESFVILDRVAFILLENPTYSLLIKGHTDTTGTKESNQILSVNRAKTCYEHLIKRGVPAKRMSFKGFGDKQPVAKNETEATRKQNRRVEFEIITE